MVISNEDKKVLLERLQKARETKAAKAAAAKKKEAPESVKEPEAISAAPAPAPVVVPVPVPVVEPQSVAVPEVPDLVAASKKKPKKVSLEAQRPDSDSDDEPVLPPKRKNAKKESAYMKIKIYREPKNPAALQDLLSAVQEEEEEQAAATSTAPVHVAPPPSIARGCKFDIKNATPREGRTLPTPQELMRRAALEFFG